MVARPKQKLRADVDRPFFIGTHVNRRIPVEMQLLLFIERKRLNRANLVRVAIYPAKLAALQLGINVC